MRRLAIFAVSCALVLGGAYWLFRPDSGAPLNGQELALARSLSLLSLPPMPADPSNAYADSPEAAELGAALFNDTGFSSNGAVACATCHQAALQFQDGLPQGQGLGTTARRTMPLSGAGYAPWLFWDGHKDSLWSQALGPVESAVEHGFTRSQVAARIQAEYAAPYAALFGPLPDLPDTAPASPLGNPAQLAAWQALPAATQDSINRIYANFGKSIAAFERTLLPEQTRFDAYIASYAADGTPPAEPLLTPQEIAGFRLFTGRGQCVNCHNGPRMSDEFFHNTGVQSPADPVTDHGRADALALVKSDPFNCLGAYSDAGEGDCAELTYMSQDQEVFERAFKTPSLRGVAGRAPYMHAGQIRTLAGVIEHYNRAFPGPSGHDEITPLNLTTAQKAALIAFLKTL